MQHIGVCTADPHRICFARLAAAYRYPQKICLEFVKEQLKIPKFGTGFKLGHSH
jgi:hypothetical protein